MLREAKEILRQVLVENYQLSDALRGRPDTIERMAKEIGALQEQVRLLLAERDNAVESLRVRQALSRDREDPGNGINGHSKDVRRRVDKHVQLEEELDRYKEGNAKLKEELAQLKR
ncbi:hypothetical protein N7532_003330 [Penicillium argentinense]|uniref:Uncharacterized protein n=1 Tax=Penicillium argentinense TaxID=1131581 RepID=A0A9W9FM77_9EURO|nr:uncharacterized protein N7532_003330 [Penicillium argentinense]KAJ5102801.1 hypothetical protein N7532_003330 [Penicillium argentinense]